MIGSKASKYLEQVSCKEGIANRGSEFSKVLVGRMLFSR